MTCIECSCSYIRLVYNALHTNGMSKLKYVNSTTGDDLSQGVAIHSLHMMALDYKISKI